VLISVIKRRDRKKRNTQKFHQLVVNKNIQGEVFASHISFVTRSEHGEVSIWVLERQVVEFATLGVNTINNPPKSFSILRSRAREESTLKSLVSGAHSRSSNANCVASLFREKCTQSGQLWYFCTQLEVFSKRIVLMHVLGEWENFFYREKSF